MVDLDSMTLGELEALAARLGAAAKTIREAMAMMGGMQNLPTAPAQTFVPEAVHRDTPNPLLTPSEVAERTRILAQNRMNLPAAVDEGAMRE